MVHAGYEASAVLGGNKKLGDTWKMLHWTLSGRMGGIVKGAPATTNGDGNGNGHHGNGNGYSDGNKHSAFQRPVSVSPQQDEVFRIL